MIDKNENKRSEVSFLRGPELAKLKDLEARPIAIEKRNIASTGVASKKIKAREMKRTVAQILTLLKERGAKV